MTTLPHLARYVRESRWSDLEDAWTSLILEDPGIEPALDAVAAAGLRKEIPRCVSFVREQAEVLLTAGRADEAARLLGRTMLLGGSPGELAAPLVQCAKAAWENEDFWEPFVELSGLSETAPDMRGAWRAFEKLLSLEPGRIIYHAKGWGLGTVISKDIAEREAKIEFASGRSDRFPFRTTIDIFEFLDESDLRCLVVSDPEELKRRLKKEPLEVLRWIVTRNGGKVNHAGIKLAMGTIGVDGSRFTAWWRRAKKAAEASEWFEISGPSTRSQVRLLDVASDPAESMRRQLKRAKSLGEALTRVRALVTGGAASEEVVSAAIETVEELADEMEDEDLPHRLATWLFLREQRGVTPEVLRESFQAAADLGADDDPSQRPALWSLVHMVPGSRDQERCIELMAEILGDEWLDHAARHMHHAAPGMARGLVDMLAQAGRTDDLIKHYKSLLARPTRNPIMLVRLAEYLENSDRVSDLPPDLRRAQCILQLACHLYRSSAGDTILTRARTRLSDALTSGDPPLLRRLLATADEDGIRNLAKMIETGVDRDIDRLFTRIAVDLSPTIFRGEDKPFWEGTGIWTSRAGLAKQEEELRILREIKIPENAEAIGKAAAFGDLSENSEWEAAIEDQRNLTRRAMELENAVRDAQLLENAALPDNTAAPGTRVRYRDLTNSTEQTVELVGPWDVERDPHVSYRSPLGLGLLGSHPGDKRPIELPGGKIEVEVLEIDAL